uniref:Chemokine interleukin-8-like domain-containing protein n=1 Tax=Amphiprion percula TaxID=161767 RepID=A0A3P8SRH8_AMPPE
TVLLKRLSLLELFLMFNDGPPRFCCTRYQETQVPVKMLKSYRIQDDMGHCNIKAVVFKTKRNKDLCGNPEEEWVQKAMELIPRNSGKPVETRRTRGDSKNSSGGGRCGGRWREVGE